MNFKVYKIPTPDPFDQIRLELDRVLLSKNIVTKIEAGTSYDYFIMPWIHDDFDKIETMLKAAHKTHRVEYCDVHDAEYRDLVRERIHSRRLGYEKSFEGGIDRWRRLKPDNVPYSLITITAGSSNTIAVHPAFMDARRNGSIRGISYDDSSMTCVVFPGREAVVKTLSSVGRVTQHGSFGQEHEELAEKSGLGQAVVQRLLTLIAEDKEAAVAVARSLTRLPPRRMLANGVSVAMRLPQPNSPVPGGWRAFRKGLPETLLRRRVQAKRVQWKQDREVWLSVLEISGLKKNDEAVPREANSATAPNLAAGSPKLS